MAQHFLYFLPDPHGHGAFLLTVAISYFLNSSNHLRLTIK